MSITPADIETQTFPVVFRGYKVESVDAFLDRLQADLTQMLDDPGATAPVTDRTHGSPVIRPDRSRTRRRSPTTTRWKRAVRLPARCGPWLEPRRWRSR